MAVKVRILKGYSTFWKYKVQIREFFFWRTIKNTDYFDFANDYYHNLIKTNGRDWEVIKQHP